MKYVPECCRGDEAKYSGEITLKVPHAKDKIKMLRTLKYKFEPGGKVIANDDLTEMLEGMLDIAEDVIIEAIIERKADKKIFTKEDLFYEGEFQELLPEVGKVVIEGMGPSKN